MKCQKRFAAHLPNAFVPSGGEVSQCMTMMMFYPRPFLGQFKPDSNPSLLICTADVVVHHANQSMPFYLVRNELTHMQKQRSEPSISPNRRFVVFLGIGVKSSPTKIKRKKKKGGGELKICWMFKNNFVK